MGRQFVIVKPSLLSISDSHFAGGKHAVLCIASTLAHAGHEVHVVCATTKGQLFVAAMKQAPWAPGLDQLKPSPAPPTLPDAVLSALVQLPDSATDQCSHDVITWQHQLTRKDGQSQSSSVHATVHAVITDTPGQSDSSKSGRPNTSWYPTLCAVVRQLVQRDGASVYGQQTSLDDPTQHSIVLVDADNCQLQPHQIAAGNNYHQTQAADEPFTCSTCRVMSNVTAPREQQGGTRDAQRGGSLLEWLVATVPARQVVALVQNVHFLPCGPSGTSCRTPGLLRAWQSLGGVVCVSQFVHQYLESHLPRELASLTGHQDTCAPQLPPMRVVRLNAWGAFGAGPFQDLGPQAVTQIQPATSETDNNSQPPQVPIIGVLKLTPEKGCSIVHELAQLLRGRYRFLIVSGDPAVGQLFAGMPHVTVIEPQPDVGTVLQQVCVVLVPSLWLEAWGMVAVDAMLRGIPIIVSSTGALFEAGLGQAVVVPVQPVQIPCCAMCNTPTWAGRRYPRQQVQPWIDALDTLIGDAAAYQQVSVACRQAALSFVGAQHDELQGFMEWLGTC